MHNSSPSSITKILKKALTSKKGNSLAEFAVITAMMATFVMTAIPKFSDVMEAGKANKSIDEIDKILLQAKHFYETPAALEGRGRLPGQDKHNMRVGEYSDTTELYIDLQVFGEFTDTLGLKWVSVFGTDHPEALVPAGTDIQDDTLSANVNGKGEVLCDNCPVAREKGADEWLELFSNEPLVSPFQDGHLVYTVVAGGGTGEEVYPPVIYVADVENAVDFNSVLEP